MNKKFSIKEIGAIAKEVLALVFSTNYKLQTTACIIALSGDLGAGKTTLTQAIARELGVKENVISPTFVIMKSYPVSLSTLQPYNFQFLFHIDAYRLDSSKELEKLGWAELVADPENLIILEWPERVPRRIPKDSIWINLKHIDKNTREITINSKIDK